MDLQAILDATDSSSGEDDDEMYSIPAGLGIHPPSPARNINSNNKFLVPQPTPPRRPRQDKQQHQQQSPALSAVSYSPHHFSATGTSSAGKVDLEQILREDDDDDDSSTEDLTSLPTSTSAYSSTLQSYQTTNTNTPEDWDVLQAILGEDDDSSSSKDEELLSSLPAGGAINTTSVPQENFSINLILKQSEDEFDFYSHGKDDKTTFSYTSSTNNNNHNSALEEKYSEGVDSFVTAAESQLSSSPDAKAEDYFTAASLKYAEAYEKKLFKSGHRDIVSPLQVKRRLKPKIELNSKMQQQQTTSATAAELFGKEKKQIHQRFNFSGTVEHKPLAILSQTMTDFATSVAKRTKNKKTALPTALAINARFLAIGLQTGIILVFDLFESLRQKLGLHDTDQFRVKTAGSVTSVDLSLQNGEFLVAGYTSGSVVLWETIKGLPLKSVTEVNPSPITSVRFLSDLKVVSVDAAGLVNKLGFSKGLLWNSYSVESDCLLDGTAGQILAMDVLPPYSFYKNTASRLQRDNFSSNDGGKAPAAFQKMVLIALSSERSSFAVAVEPKVHVLHRWAKPTPERIYGTAAVEQQSREYLPCLSWGWALVSGGGHEINPILARAWGCCLQLLRANFPSQTETEGEIFQWPAFGVHDEFDVSAPVVALEWLNDRSLIYLSENNEFTVIDTVMMTLLERLDFSGLKLVYAEFSLSRKQTQGSSSNEQKEDHDYVQPDSQEQQQGLTQFCTTFQNSVRSCDNRLLLLCQDELKTVSIVGAKKRISGLEQDGEWLEALALALDHYENTVKSQEDRMRLKKRDMSKHYAGGVKSEDEEWIAKLLVRYLQIAVENAPSPNEFPPEFRQSQLELAQSHFQMLAGVCVEFCVTTKRLDLLFGPIFARFLGVGYLSVFLDVLEPYILNDKLDYIAPEAMAHFVEHCKATNGIATVERCLLHMDVTIMDFDTILGLLKANQMYSALFYVFNQGLDDYTTPLEILAEQILDAADTLGPLSQERRPDGVPRNDLERYGYKALLYLQSCFQGKFFPQDQEMPEDKLHSVRPQLLKFLLREQYSPSHFTKIKKKKQVFGQRALRFPYTHILLLVDPHAMFDTMSLAMNAPDEEFGKVHSNQVDLGEWEDADEQVPPKRSPERQDIVQMFMSILFPQKDDLATTHQSTLHQSKPVVDAFLDFLAEYLVKGVVQADMAVTFMILNRMADKYQLAKSSKEQQSCQQQILQLLTALPRNSYDSEQVLELMQGADIHRAALLMHQEGASYWEGSRDLEKRAGHFRAAIDCYLGDADVEFRKEVFAYVKKECNAASEDDEDMFHEGIAAFDETPITMRDALASKLTDLVHLDSLMTAELVAELFVEDLDRVIVTLKNENARFKLLQAIISGQLDAMDSVAGAVLNSHLTMEHHHKYLALMAKLHPELVYEYLSNHDNYRPEECLKLCQKHEIADASAYLLERMGNVSSALQLILQTLETRMMNLKRTIRGMGSDFIQKFHAKRSTSHHRWKKHELPLSESHQKQMEEIDGVKRILVVALDVCERNSGTFSSRPTEHGSQLWFNVLDRLINAKGFLRLSKEQPGHAKVMAGVLSELLRMTMQRMVSSVPLPDLVRKVTSDHSGSRLGELREMIESLLATYGLELNVFGKATSIFKYDAQQMQKMHHSIRVKGSNVNTVMNVPLSSNKGKGRLPENGEILRLAERGNASVADIENNRGSPSKNRNNNNSGLGNALSRLRSRRSGSSGISSSNKMDANRRRGLNLMTSTDLSHRQGKIDTEAMYFEDRLSGMLGEAEHRGRLMSFMY